MKERVRRQQEMRSPAIPPLAIIALKKNKNTIESIIRKDMENHGHHHHHHQFVTQTLTKKTKQKPVFVTLY